MRSSREALAFRKTLRDLRATVQALARVQAGNRDTGAVVEWREMVVTTGRIYHDATLEMACRAIHAIDLEIDKLKKRKRRAE